MATGIIREVTSRPVVLTPSQVKKAGRVLRHMGQGRLTRPDDGMFDWESFEWAYEVMLAHRAAHGVPLTKANNGIRSVLKTERCGVEVSQRLKRVPSIVNKLVRQPNLPLSSMQDIGGCRAVVTSIEELRRVQARFSKNRPPSTVSDYIRSPRTSGYRGVHLVVTYDDRHIEVQLRTRMMHAWAITVERLSWTVQLDLKSDGDHPVQLLLACISEAMAIDEEGGVVPPQLLEKMANLRSNASPYLEGR